MPLPDPSLVFIGLLALAAIFAALMLVEDIYHYVLHLCGHRNNHYTAAGHPRSGKWPTFEHHLIEARGNVCESCGGGKELGLEGHHIEDFHAHPEKELDPDNVIILCRDHKCHQRDGHAWDWRAINPHVREDAARHRSRIKNRVYE